MTMLVRREPVAVPSIARLFDAAFGEPFLAACGACETDEGTLAVDISEDDTNVIVRASLPGFAKSDVQAEVHEGVLTIRATRTETSESKNERFYRRERTTASLGRRIALPASVAEGDPRGELQDGVLTLRLPKSAKATPRRVSIN